MKDVESIWNKAKELESNLRELLQFTKRNNNVLYVWCPSYEEFAESYDVKIREHLDDEFRIAHEEDLLPEYQPINLWCEGDTEQNKRDEKHLCTLLEELNLQVEKWGEVETNNEDELSGYMSEAQDNWNNL